MGERAIRCVGVAKRFGSVAAVDGVDLALVPGRLLALLGPSGCGKTSVLRLIAGCEVPDRGTIEIGGRVVVGPGVHVPPEKRRVGMVFQDYALFPHLSVARNVAYGLAKGSERAARVDAMLSLVGLFGLGDRMPHELSGGQQQRVALARSLAPQPDVLLLDEPFSNLDAGLRARVRLEIREILRAAGATAIFVTHDQEEALSLADEVAVMLRGRVIQVAKPEELYWSPATREVAAFVGEANLLPGEAHDGYVSCELGAWRVARQLVGKVEVMLRPESILAVADEEGPARVISREFFGHDQMLTVQLATGARLRCRLGPESAPPVGCRVRLEVRHAVVTFPGAESADRKDLSESSGRTELWPYRR